VLRPHPLKDYAIILDCVGVVSMHGLPSKKRAWSLDGKVRRQADNDNDEVRTRTCPKCFGVFEPQPVCPGMLPIGAPCLYVFPKAERREMKQVEGRLEELTEEKLAADEERAQARREQGKVQSAEEMVAKLGYSQGRANHILEAREKKRKQIEALNASLAEWQRLSGQSPMHAFGVSMYSLRKMKPKELEKLQAEVDARRDGALASIDVGRASTLEWLRQYVVSRGYRQTMADKLWAERRSMAAA
jgi:hypothetical protein